ncbi:MAG TPA: hypothetical protein VF747_04980, partial [Blastocatellia bacterium]
MIKQSWALLYSRNNFSLRQDVSECCYRVTRHVGKFKHMATPTQSLARFSMDEYRINDVEHVMTPALAIYQEIVDSNIRATLELLGGDANRWRPHVKTAKLACVMRR